MPGCLDADSDLLSWMKDAEANGIRWSSRSSKPALGTFAVPRVCSTRTRFRQNSGHHLHSDLANWSPPLLPRFRPDAH